MSDLEKTRRIDDRNLDEFVSGLFNRYNKSLNDNTAGAENKAFKDVYTCVDMTLRFRHDHHVPFSVSVSTSSVEDLGGELILLMSYYQEEVEKESEKNFNIPNINIRAKCGNHIVEGHVAFSATFMSGNYVKNDRIILKVCKLSMTDCKIYPFT